MGLGILEDRTMRHVPGTSTILDSATERSATADTLDPNLKYDRSGTTPILLVPQPSDDPNDPLNWPLWQRDMILLALSLMAIIATTLSPILAADSLEIAFHFYISFTKVALLTGYHLLGVAVAGIVFVPSGRVWGKRHLYLLGTILVCASSAWAGASVNNYKSLLWARVIQGVGLAPFEALLGASVGDLYYVHERGKRMALSTLAVFGSAFLTPVVVGKIAETIGWNWSFYLVAIISGALFPVCFFLCPETAFLRAAELDTDIGGGRDVAVGNLAGSELANRSPSGSSASGEAKLPHHHTTQTLPPAERSVPVKTSYARSLLPFNGRKTNQSFFKLLLRPFPIFFQPGILWACLTQGTLIGWTVLIGITLAAIMLGPPLWFTALQVGYMYSSAFIGALVGFVISGLASDSSAKWLTKRNGGVYEPEFRIILVIPQMVLGGIGLYGFGITAQNSYRYGWIGPEIFLGFVTAGMVCGAVASALYVVDAHRDLAVEAFTCLIIFKNVFSFALTFKGYDWLVKLDPKPIFMIVASVQMGVCLLSIPMYVFGKRNRAFWARHDVLARLGLD